MNKIKQKIIIGALACFIMISAANAENGFTITQEQSILSIEFSERCNITIAFYDEHQVYVAESANITSHYNCSIPDRLAVTGGYYRVANIAAQEQITAQEFIVVTPWEAGENGYNPPEETETPPAETNTQGVVIEDSVIAGGSIAVGLTVSLTAVYYMSKGEKK